MHAYLGTVCTIFGSISKDYHIHDNHSSSSPNNLQGNYPSSSQYETVTDIHSVKTLFLCMQWHGLCAAGCGLVGLQQESEHLHVITCTVHVQYMYSTCTVHVHMVLVM